MFDIILKNDLLNINRVDNINAINFNRKEMKKIIRCRTQDKIEFLKFLLSYNVIDGDFYQELLKRAKNDFKKANRCCWFFLNQKL